MLWSGGGFSYRSIFRLTNKSKYLGTSFSTLVRPTCRSALRLIAQGIFSWQNPFPACKIPAFPRSLIDFINLYHQKSSSPQKPLEDMETKPAVFARSGIIEGDGKISSPRSTAISVRLSHGINSIRRLPEFPLEIWPILFHDLPTG